MDLGLVLGGVAKGATDTFDTIQTNNRANTKSKDEHAQAVRLQKYQADSDANAEMGGIGAGLAIGSTNGDSQPLGSWAADRGLDPASFGSTAADAMQHPVFSQPQPGITVGDSSDGTDATGGLPPGGN